MARQVADPPLWNPALSDGCSAPWPFNWLMERYWRKYCLIHDEEHWYGGLDWEQKLASDSKLYWNIFNSGKPTKWIAEKGAKVVYGHLRFYGFNYPPWHPSRSWRQVTKVRAWNWEGPGMLEMRNG